MKKSTLILSIATASFLFSCEMDGQTGDRQPTDAAQERTEERLETREDRLTGLQDDADDLIETASANMLKVDLSQHATENATTEEVRGFASEVASFNSQAQENLRSLAQEKDITLPRAMDEDKRDRVSDVRERTGEEYDQEYLDEIVNTYDEDIDRMERLAEEAEDTDIRNWAANYLTTAREHKERAEQLQERFNGGQDMDLFE
jgi:putative membrane protein